MRDIAPFLMLFCLLCLCFSSVRAAGSIPTTPMASITSSFTCFTTLMGMLTGGLGGGLF